MGSIPGIVMLTAVLRNLVDKPYEKRKNATLEVLFASIFQRDFFFFLFDDYCNLIKIVV